MLNKATRRNVMPAAALTAGTTTSHVEQAKYGSGIRFYVTVSDVTAAGTSDSFNLCAVPPGSDTPIPLAGFTAANLLCTAGVWMFDFYPSAWLPSAGMSTTNLKGAAGIYLPQVWAAQAVLGAGNAATITVDAEILP